MAAKLGMSLRTLEGVFGSFPIFEHPYQYRSRCWGLGKRLMEAISIGSGFNLFLLAPKAQHLCHIVSRNLGVGAVCPLSNEKLTRMSAKLPLAYISLRESKN